MLPCGNFWKTNASNDEVCFWLFFEGGRISNPTGQASLSGHIYQSAVLHIIVRSSILVNSHIEVLEAVWVSPGYGALLKLYKVSVTWFPHLLVSCFVPELIFKYFNWLSIFSNILTAFRINILTELPFLLTSCQDLKFFHVLIWILSYLASEGVQGFDGSIWTQGCMD